MTNTPDTSPEAVERLAKYHDWRPAGESKTAATLRALSDERDALKMELAEAVEVISYADRMVKLDLQHMTEWGGEHFNQAVFDTGQRISAFHARHQRETGA